MSQHYRALVLDLDGTLITDAGTIHPRTLAALKTLDARGVRVMVATGRSDLGVLAVLDELGFDTPALVFNGAGLWCPRAKRLLEERLLSDRVVARCFAYVERSGLLPVLQCAGVKFSPPPRDALEAHALAGLEGLRQVPFAELPREYVIRATFFSGRHPDSAAPAREIEGAVAQPLYLTHFPLSSLATHRTSPLLVADVQPPSRGKGEALRVLQERYGIAPAEVVAVGDADNDLEMLAGAGLGVAMANAMPRALATARRVIGDNNGDSLARLVEELWP